MPSHSKAAITAVGANLLIAGAKFTAYLFTRSAGMLSECIHSLVDAGNGGLLLFGEKRSGKPADETHPFGYGKELYFWSLVVALMIFALGGGFSIYEGLHRLREPQPLQHPFWSYATLGLAALFESYSFFVSLKEFREKEGVPASFRTIHASKDPITFTVIYEDAAALLGLLIALAGTLGSHVLAWQLADGLASLCIGALLLGVAFLLIAESKALLVGEAVSVEGLRQLHAITLAQAGVESAGYPMTMYFGPRQILLTMNIRFSPELTRNGIERTIDRIEVALRTQNPHIRHISLEAESLQGNQHFDPGRLPRRT